MDKNYKELYPKEYNTGYLLGEKAYENSESYEESVKVFKVGDDVTEQDVAKLEGFVDGYFDTRDQDYRCCFKEQEYE